MSRPPNIPRFDHPKIFYETPHYALFSSNFLSVLSSNRNHVRNRSRTLRHEDVWGSGDEAPRTLNLETSWRWMVIFTPQRLYPQTRRYWCQWLEEWVVPRVGVFTMPACQEPWTSLCWVIAALFVIQCDPMFKWKLEWPRIQPPCSREHTSNKTSLLLRATILMSLPVVDWLCPRL